MIGLMEQLGIMSPEFERKKLQRILVNVFR